MILGDKTRRVAIVGANRIPFARSNGKYSNVTNQDMLTAAFDGIVSKFNLEGKMLGEVAGGAVVKHSKDFNLVRECVLSTKLHPNTPACDLQQACDTGLEAAVYIANKIALGQIEVGMAGGTDTTSDAPIMVSEGLRKILLKANTEKTIGGKLKQLMQFRPKHLIPVPPSNSEPRTGLAMGDHQQIAADVYKAERADQDELAYNSHINMAKAYEEGFFDDLISPFNGLDKDDNLRPSSTIEKLATLKGVFKGSGSMTAGNSTPLTDGASAVLLCSEEYAKEQGWEVLAFIKTAQLAATEFVDKKEDLLMAPVAAVGQMLKKNNMKLQDFDFYEIHEAFASQVLCTLNIWESDELSKQFGLDGALGAIDRSKLNVKGSSLAAGHPFAATGGRLLGVAAKLLNEKGSGKALISICAAGGQGLVAILEK